MATNGENKYGVRKSEVHICSICQTPYTGWGNSAWPVSEGRCCDDCNNTRVISARQKQNESQRPQG
jgi:hypothetical protein